MMIFAVERDGAISGCSTEKSIAPKSESPEVRVMPSGDTNAVDPTFYGK
jgi:hypothetical protein